MGYDRSEVNDSRNCDQSLISRLGGSTLQNLVENTKQGVSYFSGKFNSIQEYVTNQLRMADCCNNVQMVDDSHRTNVDISRLNHQPNF
mmetsp:Transcript_3476/g.5916  ORF Transcript_3476/g.5916 Transcript_3476/m.5916 type:complete len:88 (-) Transcript_3476:65-328(-)